MERTVIVIPADRIGNISSDGNIRKCRVAAYCRVSTDKEEQLTSYHNQIAYYANMISEHVEWEYVDIYADEGITGTKVWLRDEFNRLLDDCRKGLIDLVLVKSISRFARNTVDCLKYVRELRMLHVDVFFENQNIHSLSSASDFLITMHAMHAQEQSVSNSNNQRWSVRNRMQSGTWLPYFMGYGYIIRDGEIVKDENAIEVIELIKKLYLNGYSIARIKKELKKKKLLSPRGREEWSEPAIGTILSDPLYRGHLIAQKTYTTETFPFERRQNNGEMPKYLYQDDHEPYISKEDAEKIDHIFLMRKGAQTRNGTFRNGLSGKVFCQKCKSSMKRITIAYNKKIGYSCVLHIRDNQKCSNKSVMEKTIHIAFINMVNKLKFHKYLLESYLKDLEMLNRYAMSMAKESYVKQNYQSVKKQIYETALKYNRGLCESAFYVEKMKQLRNKANILYEQLKTTRSETGYLKEIKETKRIRELLEGIDYLKHFNEELFISIVNHVEAGEQKDITFHLCNGMAVKEEVQIDYEG